MDERKETLNESEKRENMTIPKKRYKKNDYFSDEEDFSE